MTYGAFTFQSLIVPLLEVLLCQHSLLFQYGSQTKWTNVMWMKLLLLFSDLVKLIERTVRSEYFRLPKRPIYIVGESIGACLALDVAASNPDIDLVLILANPGKARLVFSGSLRSFIVFL